MIRAKQKSIYLKYEYVWCLLDIYLEKKNIYILKENIKTLFCRKFAILLRFVMVVIVAHTICIVAYQTPWMQDHLDENSLAAR